MNKQLLLQEPGGDSVRFERLDCGEVLIVSNCYEENDFTVIAITTGQERELFRWLALTRGTNES